MTDLIFLGSKINADGDCSHKIKSCLLFGRKAMTNLNSILKSRDFTLLYKVQIVKAMVFPVVTYECESWTIKKAEHWATDAFKLWYWRRPLESSLDTKEIKSVNPKVNQAWIFIGRLDAKGEARLFRPPDANSQLIGKDPDAGKNWGQEKKGATENEMVGWHHQIDGHEFQKTLGDSKGKGNLVCCNPLGCKESTWLSN